ncbi:hypothetical protein EES44_18320 [Streptomyces sp. ADI96-15]|nr:hypothetical protein EES44_18320 [Streptomyces sp. ADI96-15]
MAEDLGGLFADEGEQGGLLFGAVAQGVDARGEPLGARGRFAGGAGGGRGGELPDLGQVREEGAGAGGGESHVEPLPLHIRDHDGRFRVAGHRAEGRDSQAGVHHGQTVAAGGRLDVALGGHAALVPDAPGDGGGGQSQRVPLLGERVQVGVAGGVVALSGGAQGAGEGGEEHEGVQVGVPGQLVQVPGAVGLDPQDLVDPVGGEAVDDGVVQDGGGVHDRRQGTVGGHGREQLGEGRAVSDVARGEGGLDAAPLQFAAEFGGARRVRAAPADQQEVLGALLREVTGHAGAETSGTAGHQDGAARAPRQPSPGRASAGQAPDERAGRAQGHLVLAAAIGQDRREEAARGPVGPCGQVDESAEPLGVFQGRDPAEAPHHLLGGGVVAHGPRVLRGGGDRVMGQAPQGAARLGPAERLEQGGGGGESGAPDPLLGVAAAVDDAQQGQHTRKRPLGQQVRDVVPGGVRGHGEPGDVTPVVAHGGGDRVGAVGRCDGIGGDRQQPRPGQDRGGGQRGGGPAHVVLPGVNGGPLRTVPAPGPQSGQHTRQGVPVHVEQAGEGLGVVALHRFPEAGVVAGA